MSQEGEATGFMVAEKLFALLIILIGTIVVYNTSISPGLNARYPVLFAVGGLALIILGIFMVLARVQ